MARAIALAVALATASSGCSAVLYYGFPEKATTEADRRARVVVRSHPTGATVVAADGRILGPTPLAAEVDYVVRSTTTRSSSVRGALGCAVDIAALAGGLVWSASSPDSTAADVAFYASLGLFAGCFSLALVKAINAALMRRVYRAMQAPQILSAPIHRSDEVVAGSLAVEARWVDGGRAQATLRGPGQSEVLLRQPPARTFDEAIMRYDERRSRPLGSEGLFRRGSAYHARAKQTGNAEAAHRARLDLQRLIADPATPPDRAAQVRAMLAELAEIGGKR